MKILTINDQIINISNKAEMVIGGIQLDSCILAIQTNKNGEFEGAIPTIYDFNEEIPENIIPYKYNYNPEKGFWLNPKYEINKTYELENKLYEIQKENKLLTDKINQLETNNQSFESELASINYTLMMGGLV